MTSQRIAQTNQQQKSEKLQGSGILQRAAVRSIADAGVQSTDDQEELALSNSAFSKDFSRVPISTTKPQQMMAKLKVSPVVQHKNTLASVQLKEGQATQRQKMSGELSDRIGTCKEHKENKTGLPDNLKAGIENLSGMAMDDVRVYYNSDKPAQLQALAYTQGTHIHVAPGQEKHLSHEAWHVVQQKQGRVKPTIQEKGIEINDDDTLEKEADLMGVKAFQIKQAYGAGAKIPFQKATDRDNPEKFSLNIPDISSSGKIISSMSGTQVAQLFTVPPGAPPGAGVRNRNLNQNGVPDESHITTRHGQSNDLVGTVPGVNINGWPYIQGVNATGAWVRFHLVNQQIGGLGNQDNLVPTSQATNQNANWRNFERTCQHHVGQQTSVHVTVDVQYHPSVAAGVGTLAANQHFYPTQISGRCYLWNAATNTYNLNGNGAPANRTTFQVQIAPFPLLPPAANANQTDLTQQAVGWLRNTLMGGIINPAQATQLQQALQPGNTINDYIRDSQEPTNQSKLLDALDSFLAVDLQNNNQVPQQGRIDIINGIYHI
ncbi:eCIS core domain-containing protein [Nostoc sp.]|uniref:eCIS core domain-containing protein n=1 Tax=Nostoc sp. TaxID=1180 RepID=UPI002FFBA930